MNPSPLGTAAPQSLPASHVAVPRSLLLIAGALAVAIAAVAGTLAWQSAHAPTTVADAASLGDAKAAAAGGMAPTESARPDNGAIPAKPLPIASTRRATPAERTPADIAGSTTQASADAGPYVTQPVAQTPPPAVCGICGVIESVQPIAQHGQGTGLGAVAGGVLGGVLGNQVGRGSGRTAATVIGAIGGGLVGNEVEKRSRTTTAYQVGVRMEDGTLRSVQQSHAPAVGQRVTLEGNRLKIVNAPPPADAPRSWQTSAPGSAS